MNYAAFFNDLNQWIQENNKQAQLVGFDTMPYWNWVTHTTGELSKKYDDNWLVIKMLVGVLEYLDEVAGKQK
ncbi:hypothetical protein FC83_GL000929 [Agrilactobacillus composti DSM 18527 = JCM 14202]|uniref:Uncharacterized protein n=1 Tax=Agrilactobacillus composti DSM 18527 = JCM 14202 TaxID=1423734 RepID=X0PGT4_9LACO|nr:hypothetical protein [Agrilactobacillus composti]KRM35625.1 hypothetical protein FC83_GL000929 [Agrilactobacillus composti DSM 18527 = JCM 14202]GAF41143.1 hypothetical protein JCM14202_3068 [Agrilactobacillus composti DSM 18527 = JCM 14202]